MAKKHTPKLEKVKLKPAKEVAAEKSKQFLHLLERVKALESVFKETGVGATEIAERVKKQVKKQVKKEMPQPNDALIENLVIIVNETQGKLVSLNQRIDRIVAAHDKCKSLKGL
jgi:hypothetical protein